MLPLLGGVLVLLGLAIWRCQRVLQARRRIKHGGVTSADAVARGGARGGARTEEARETKEVEMAKVGLTSTLVLDYQKGKRCSF